MREAEIAVTFYPAGRTAYVLPGSRLIEAAGMLGIGIDFPCGGQGTCGKCRVRIRCGAQPPKEAEARVLTAAELADGWRLACQTTVVEPMEVEVAAGDALHQIFVGGVATASATIDPAVRRMRVEMSPPQRGDDAPDLLRLERALGMPFTPTLAIVRRLAAALPASGYRGTAVLLDDTLIDFEPGDHAGNALAVAVDLGTTTLAASLVDLESGAELAVESRLNPQTRAGDDVLSRILYVSQRPEALAELAAAASAAIDEMIAALCQQAGAKRESVYEVCIAGNTTMQQLFCAVDPRSLGAVPFAPTLAQGLAFPAAEVGLHVHPRGRVCLFPVIGGFVGGDTVAGIVATGIDHLAGPTLLVDIGTNGEIVLWADGKLSAASTAAGPAFEGARIMQGMRGSQGAIEKVVVDDGRLRINVIGNVAPRGICGSGLIDAAAELLRHHALSPQGRLFSAEQLPANVPADLRRRMVAHDGKPALLLAEATETDHGQPIVLTQRDLRELQLATGAIRAGIEVLLRRAGLKPVDLEDVLVAGGFGNFVRRSNAQRIGLLPHQIERTRIRYQGNTSLAGARMAALSVSARQRGEELARRTEHVDLSTDPSFRDAFAEAMLFPEE